MRQAYHLGTTYEFEYNSRSIKGTLSDMICFNDQNLISKSLS